ncbi:hypothetical protein DACRYDRAFT_19322 [Dacryopinax primogenitus]|uniref:Pentacotripeptide-repeat region of PRORP domain-containing protein n=1 Tax=Dacryopinax primogenitus (strain DJM 731) TaxID=1858805 RepID=M5G6V5_DACPD|nr:uncharacterized protein DACRYDRAFT_19322 [Dacryopinax primogenitus]EJU05986.1 hypothetical protein DACRYDRAFT_19322 [Dacryopinax primogenitus]
MIPKFATHLLQLKSQGTHHIRNVLQSTSSTTSLPWSGVGSSSSSWGSSTGAGGAKFNAGSRFYAGYTGPGRVITQATSIPAADGSNGQLDDTDERNQALRAKTLSLTDAPRLPRRRSSVSLLSSRQHLSPEAPNEAQSSAIHTQAKHAFMNDDRVAATTAEGCGDVSPRTRRNSTSVLDREVSSADSDTLDSDTNGLLSQATEGQAVDEEPAPLRTDATLESQVVFESALSDHQTANESRSSEQISMTREALHEEPAVKNIPVDREGEGEHGLSPTDLERYNALKLAKQSGSVLQVMQEIRRLRQSDDAHSVGTYNMALLAVNAVRTKGMPIAVILELYNEMLERNLVPNSVTYANVIRALCDRDHDINELIASGQLSTSDQNTSARTAAANPDASAVEHARLLRREENFASAMALFNAAHALRASHFGIEIYNVLLRSAGYRGDIESAIRVYSHLERRSDIKPTIATYGHLISAYARGKDVDAAQDIFNEFRNAAKSGSLDWGANQVAARRVFMQVYNRMISAYFQCGEPRGALALLEEMLGPHSKENFGPSDIPAPSTSTFTEIIAGFCDSGDVRSAVKWFERLLQSQTTAPRNDPYAASKSPLRPDREAWVVIFRHLAEAGQLEKLEELLSRMIETAPQGYVPLQASDINEFISVNTDYLSSSEGMEQRSRSLHIVKQLKSILPQCATIAKLSNQRIYAHEWTLTRTLIQLGEFSDALRWMDALVSRELQDIEVARGSKVGEYLTHGLQRSLLQSSGEFLEASQHCEQTLTLTQLLDLMAILREAGVVPETRLHAALVSMYMNSKTEWLQKMPERTSLLSIINSFIAVHASAAAGDAVSRSNMEPYFTSSSSLPGMEYLLEDLRATASPWNGNIPLLVRDVVPIYETLIATGGPEFTTLALEKLGSLGQEAIRFVDEQTGLASACASESDAPLSSSLPSESGKVASNTDATALTSEVDSASSVSEYPLVRPQRIKPAPFKINYKLSSMIESQRHRLDEPMRFFGMIVNDAKRRLFVTPSALSLVINALGRSHHLDKARELYSIAQIILASLEDDKESQTRAWFAVEDAMLCTHAFANDMDTANVHRARMIEQGGAPSAEAYAVLIMTVNDFTDDCNVAMSLYNEAISLGVVPNVFLYNNIISKLSKARKAEAALEIFQEMKKHGVRPTSVTYGALVGACCRVGDADTAMYLFSEMSAQANFRPKAPPFNTMIQFFVHTKPDRERALHYYNLMVASNVQPSAHTYKLLMDAYGLIEPVDMSAVQIVFDQLVARKDLQVQGNHWASLITAWGCSCKDVERARSIFDSILSHPTTLRSGQKLPDAQTWEAFINVLVTQHRFDLLGPTLENLHQSGVHMTAYIANVVIRGYASAGSIEQARAVFEGMRDPPEGMAASFNHLAYNSVESIPVSTDAPVYREPSTYEAMIRAEMGVGERARALGLLERMEGRHFPPAVEARIRGLVNQTITSEWIPDLFDLQGWQTGSYGMDLAHLPVAPITHYTPPPVDMAMYVEASA